MVLVYQIHGTHELNKLDIPKGYEPRIKAAVDQLARTHTPMSVKNLKLRWDEVKGIMSEEEYANLYALFTKEPEKGSGYANFLEFGDALKKKQDLDKWKKKL